MLDYKTRNAYIGWLPFHLGSFQGKAKVRGW